MPKYLLGTDNGGTAGIDIFNDGMRGGKGTVFVRVEVCKGCSYCIDFCPTHALDRCRPAARPARQHADPRAAPGRSARSR